MNQKFAFYLLSIFFVFFIGYSYSQFNLEIPEPVIIRIDNSDEIEQYKAEISSLQLQLDELDTELINTYEEFIKTHEKFSRSQNTVQSMRLDRNQQDHENARLIQDLSLAVYSLEKEINSLREQLANTSIDLELSQFEIELLEEQLSRFLQE